MFGRPGSRTEYVENATQIIIDIIRGEKKISQLLERSPVEGAISLGGNVGHTKAQTFQNRAYDFPIVKEQGSVTYGEALKYRLAGEVDVNSGILTTERARVKFAEIIMTNIKKMAGRMEAEAAESMLTGVITLDDGGSYDFDRSASNTMTPLVLWSVVATADPIGNIEDACDAVQENGKTEAMAGIIGYEALNAMVGTDQITDIADNRRFEFVQVGDQRRLPDLPSEMQYLVANGFKYMAYLKTFKGRDIYLLTYNEKYQNSAGTWVDYMNSKDVLLFDPAARYDRYFGPRIRFDLQTQDEMIMNRLLGLDAATMATINGLDAAGVIDARFFHHDGFLSEDKTTIMLESYSGPLFVPAQIDAAALLDGVIA